MSSVAVQGSGTFNNKTYESSTTISATVTPSDATDLTVTWSLAWASTSSATISDYVALSSTTSSSGDSITVYCYQPFGTQIILTATADAGLTSDVTATATLDYYKSFTLYQSSTLIDTSIMTSDLPYSSSMNIISRSTTVDLYTEFYRSATFSYGTGTLTETPSVTLTFTVNSDALNVIQNCSSTLYNFCIKSSGSYSVTVPTSSGTIMTADDLILGAFNMTSANLSKYLSEVYTCLKALQESDISLFDLTISLTGASSGKVSTLSTYFTIDYSGYYTEATAVSLNETNLYF